MGDFPGPKKLERPALAVPLPDFSSVKESIALAAGGVAEAMRGFYPQLRDVWEIPVGECRTVGSLWQKYLESIPEERRSRWLIAIVSMMPLVAALGITVIVFVPRFRFTLDYMASRRNGRAHRMPPQTFPPGTVADTAGDAVAAAAASAAAATDDTGFPSAYDGERRPNEYAGIDGSEAGH